MTGQIKKVIIGIILFVLFIIIVDALYVVSETNQVIITQFGRPVGGTISSPGLHVKFPFIQKCHSFEKRWLEWDGETNQITTKDKTFIWIDTYARWRISDPLKFFQRVRDERGAQLRLDDVIDSETRNAVAKFDLIEIVRSSNRDFEVTEETAILDVTSAIPKIEIGRDEIARIILEESSKITPEFGVELKDVRIKRVNYISDVQKKVFDRMIAERQRIASKYRSEGDGESAKIRGQKERELKRIRSEAYRTSQEIMGKADAEAARIYAQAYNRDPEFYSFIKTLDTYRATIDTGTTLMLTTESEYFKFLKKVR